MAIDVVSQVTYWLEGSADDLEAAETLLRAGKLRQAGFFSHLSVEKAIKARVVTISCDIPPRSHDLLFLAAKATLSLSPDQERFLGRLQMYCLEERYPTELPPHPDLERLREDMERAKEMIRWLTQPLKKL